MAQLVVSPIASAEAGQTRPKPAFALDAPTTTLASPQFLLLLGPPPNDTVKEFTFSICGTIAREGVHLPHRGSAIGSCIARSPHQQFTGRCLLVTKCAK